MKKQILLISFTCCILHTAFSQFPLVKQWDYRFGGTGADNLYTLKQTADGGFILGGESNSDSSGDKTQNHWGPQYSYDYWIVKTDSLGAKQWDKTFGGTSGDVLYAVQQTTDGGYILGGSSSSGMDGDKTQPNWDTICSPYCTGDYWIVKTDALGNKQWDKRFGGTNVDYLYSIQQTTDGGFILGGWSYSGISGDKTQATWNGSFDFWIVKTDSLGNKQWDKDYGGTDDEELFSVQQTVDGGYILGGTSWSGMGGDKTQNNRGPGQGTTDYWILKTDSLGNKLWDKTFGGRNWEFFGSLRQTADGGFILGGTSNSADNGDKTQRCWGAYDYWIIKTDSVGKMQWDKDIGGTHYEQGIGSVSQTLDGGYLIAGYSNSPIGGDKTDNCLGNDGTWIVKTDALGNVEWDKTLQTNEAIPEETGFAIQTQDGSFLMAMSSYSPASGDKTQPSWGIGTDYWMIKFTAKYNQITGKLFADLNNNQTQDVSEPYIDNQKVIEATSGRFYFSNQNGYYNISVLDSGNFSVVPELLNYYNTVPASQNIYFSTIHQTDSLNDFAFQPAGVYNDLCVILTPVGAFRAGFNQSYRINYENVGTTTLNGTIVFFPDSDVWYSFSNVTPTSVTPDSIVWNVGTLTPFQKGNILVTVHVNPAATIGTLINSSVRIDPVAGDANTACNYSSYEMFVTGSFDPNAIVVDRDSIYTTELSSPPYLDYIIWFQNTGNDTAFNVKVLNKIPLMLDVNSFEFETSSHPLTINYNAQIRLMEFDFNNIQLPDGSVNKPESHGFLRYRIKPLSTLVSGDSIKNNAAIYFDFNQPVSTDTAMTVIVLPTGIIQLTAKSLPFTVYPNPADAYIEINSNLKRGDEIRISDTLGKLLFTTKIKIPTSNFQLPTSNLSPGIYFIKAGNEVRKFVKE